MTGTMTSFRGINLGPDAFAYVFSFCGMLRFIYRQGKGRMNKIDYILLAAYLLIMLGMGWFLRVRGQRDEEYFLAGRRMGWLPIGISVMITVFSAINYVALPNEIFSHGLYVLISLPVFLLVAWPISRCWIPFFHTMRLTSAYEYLEYRFDVRVRCLAGAVFILWRLFWIATALYATGSILSVLTGLPVSWIILTAGITATFYTFLGGMRAVMWTDVAQFSILFGGIALGVCYACREAGGFAGVLTAAHQGGRLRPFLPFDPSFFSWNPTLRITFWSGLIGTFVAFLARYGADQVVMQRYFTARSLIMARRGIWFNAVISILSLALLALFGLAVYVYAAKTGALNEAAWSTLPPAARTGVAMKQLATLIRTFPTGITGLICAGLLAATMSSIDSGINSCSAVYMVDFHNRLFCPGGSKKENHIRIDRRLTLLLGILSTGGALLLIPAIGKTNSLFVIMNKVINGLGAPLLALFLMGMFCRRANAPGMLIGGLIGLAGSLYLSLCVDILALHYYAVVNLAVVLIPCGLFSMLIEKTGYTQPAACEKWLWHRRDPFPR